MIRSLNQRFNAIGIITNATTARSISSSSCALSSRALSTALQNSVMRNSMEAKKCHPIGNADFTKHVSRRPFHLSTFRPKSIDDVHVTIETSESSNNTKTEQSTPDSSSSDSSSSGGSCSQGVPNLVEEEAEMEEMFVTADPSLGLGNVQEWGGPRRGGRLEEPTRYGDWERKGRCTDF
mmetsp:Transcript_14452/g.31344  ORF Transcript_14452/g.31344 Transcript_14452/m.31344 type:complete len:179 (-) Transcript_14452:187-723(-)